MRINSKTAVSTRAALLVPYEAHHVRKYHGWMSDPAMREATASEPMTLEEEYENQLSWREAHDKLTFIVCQPRGGHGGEGEGGGESHEGRDGEAAGHGAREERASGDVNFFLYPADDDADDAEGEDGGEGPRGAAARWLVGEVDVMIADEEQRGRGLGGGAVRALLAYVRRNEAALLAQYAAGAAAAAAAAEGGVKLRGVMAKIKEGNTASLALFERLGFTRRGGVDYFGELMLAMGWHEVAERVGEWGARDGYDEIGL